VFARLSHYPSADHRARDPPRRPLDYTLDQNIVGNLAKLLKRLAKSYLIGRQRTPARSQENRIEQILQFRGSRMFAFLSPFRLMFAVQIIEPAGGIETPVSRWRV